jgi:molybdate transport system substrate-binding protein
MSNPLRWALCLLIAGCTPNGQDSPSSNSAEPTGELLVFAASSLTEAFRAIEKDFEEEHPTIQVTLNLAGTQTLRAQIENGARAQVLAAANPNHMRILREKKLVDAPALFAHNTLIIVTPKDNPAGLESVADLPKAKRLVLAGEVVPIGIYTKQMLKRASRPSALGSEFFQRVLKSVVSRETNVRQTLQKVLLGEADAAIVYATDAAAAGNKVKAIRIPREYNVTATYPIATVTGAPRPHLGQRFVAFVRSRRGKARLKEFGFSTPAAAK